MKLSACTAILLLPLLGTVAVAEEFTLPDLTVEQPKAQKRPQGAPAVKAAGLDHSTSKWQPDSTDKAVKAFTPQSDICGSCQFSVKARQETPDERIRRHLESFE